MMGQTTVNRGENPNMGTTSVPTSSLWGAPYWENYQSPTQMMGLIPVRGSPGFQPPSLMSGPLGRGSRSPVRGPLDRGHYSSRPVRGASDRGHYRSRPPVRGPSYRGHYRSRPPVRGPSDRGHCRSQSPVRGPSDRGQHITDITQIGLLMLVPTCILITKHHSARQLIPIHFSHYQTYVISYY